MKSSASLRKSIKICIVLFIAALVLSGATAFALEIEFAWLNNSLNNKQSGLSQWINKVYIALHQTNLNYPYLAYGYDWQAFAHLVIVVAFIGPLNDPVKNKWVIQFGIIACCMIFRLPLLPGILEAFRFTGSLLIVPLEWSA